MTMKKLLKLLKDISIDLTIKHSMLKMNNNNHATKQSDDYHKANEIVEKAIEVLSPYEGEKI